MPISGTRKLKLALALFLFVAGGGAIAVKLALGRLEDPAFVLGLARQAMGGALPGSIEIQRIAVELPGTVRLTGVRFSVPELPDRPLFSCGEAQGELRLKDLASGRVTLERLRLREFQVALVRLPDGSFVLPKLGPGRRAAARATGRLVPPDRALLATAGALAAVPFQIASIECAGGRIEYDDRALRTQLSVTDVEGRMAFSPAALEVAGMTGRILDGRTVRLTGRFGLTPTFMPDLTLQCPDLPIRLLQAQAGLGGAPWAGSLGIQLQWRLMAGSHHLSGPLSFKQVSLIAEQLRQTISIPSGTLKIAADLAPEGALKGALDLDLAGLTVTPLDPGYRLPCDALMLGVDVSGINLPSLVQAIAAGNLPAIAGALGTARIGIRACDAKVGGGTVSLKGALQGFQSQLDVQVNRVGLSPIVSTHRIAASNPWLSAATVRTLSGKLSLGGLDFAPLELEVGASAVSASGSLRPALSGGFEPAAVRGTAEVEGALLAALVGAELGRFTGRASLGYTLETTGFSCELRSANLSMKGNGPEIAFAGLAAAAVGKRQASGRHDLMANVRASAFTLTWPDLVRGMGVGIDGPLKMDSGEAFVRSDDSGVHVSGLRCMGSASLPSPVSLIGQLAVSPAGALSGGLRATAAAFTKDLQLGGTLAAPQVVTR